MTSIRYARIHRELKLVASLEQFEITPDESNTSIWSISFQGPLSSPYDKGWFNLGILFPETYPYEAPTIQFYTKIYHPNISSKGEVCLSIIKSWSSKETIKNVLVELWGLLMYPNIQDPLMPDIAAMCEKDSFGFQQRAKDWVLMYACKDRDYDIL